jgi:hypothetical protein
MFMKVSSILLVVGMIVLAALSRLVPHYPNFTPVAAMALFGAAVLPRKWMAVVVPFVALYISDLALNNLVYAEYYSGFYWGVNGFVYLGFALTIVLGAGLLRGKSFSWLRLGGAVVSSTALFFLVTNFGSWLGNPVYPQDAMGLTAAYAAGLPFMLNTLGSTALFAGLLFGGYRYLAPTPLLAEERV